MSNVQTHYHFKLDFHKVDQHTGGKWLIHGTTHHKDTQLQNCPVEYPSRELIHDIKEPESDMFNPLFKENVNVNEM